MLTQCIGEITKDIENERWDEAAKCAAWTTNRIREQGERHRGTIMINVASGVMDVQFSSNCLKAIRWLERVSTHLARITYHLDQVAHAPED